MEMGDPVGEPFIWDQEAAASQSSSQHLQKPLQPTKSARF
uniref:Uncharacterized protein n=1 Tax=Manihot esculenta TaxID=3983 RepID=A0A2C9UXZ2_MANES